MHTRLLLSQVRWPLSLGSSKQALESEGADGHGARGRGGSQPFRTQPYGCYATAEKANHASSIAGAPQTDETGAGRLSCCPAEADPIAWGTPAGCNSSVPGPSPASGSSELKHLETRTADGTVIMYESAAEKRQRSASSSSSSSRLA